MSNRSKTVRTDPAAAIVVAAIVVSASILFAVSPYGLGGSRTTTQVRTTTSTLAPSPIHLFKVTFNESSTCVPPRLTNYYRSWYVTMDNVTIVQPSNMTAAQAENQTTVAGDAYKSISEIVFTVPDGSYLYYTSLPPRIPPTGTAGIITVNGSDQVVPVPTSSFCP